MDSDNEATHILNLKPEQNVELARRESLRQIDLAVTAASTSSHLTPPDPDLPADVQEKEPNMDRFIVFRGKGFICIGSIDGISGLTLEEQHFSEYAAVQVMNGVYDELRRCDGVNSEQVNDRMTPVLVRLNDELFTDKRNPQIEGDKEHRALGATVALTVLCPDKATGRLTANYLSVGDCEQTAFDRESGTAESFVPADGTIRNLVTYLTPPGKKTAEELDDHMLKIQEALGNYFPGGSTDHFTKTEIDALGELFHFLKERLASADQKQVVEQVLYLLQIRKEEERKMKPVTQWTQDDLTVHLYNSRNFVSQSIGTVRQIHVRTGRSFVEGKTTFTSMTDGIPDDLYGDKIRHIVFDSPDIITAVVRLDDTHREQIAPHPGQPIPPRVKGRVRLGNGDVFVKGDDATVAGVDISPKRTARYAENDVVYMLKPGTQEIDEGWSVSKASGNDLTLEKTTGQNKAFTTINLSNPSGVDFDIVNTILHTNSLQELEAMIHRITADGGVRGSTFSLKDVEDLIQGISVGRRPTTYPSLGWHIYRLWRQTRAS
jgi:hypothetical protein